MKKIQHSFVYEERHCARFHHQVFCNPASSIQHERRVKNSTRQPKFVDGRPIFPPSSRTRLPYANMLHHVHPGTSETNVRHRPKSDQLCDEKRNVADKSGRGNLTALLHDNSGSMYTLWPLNSPSTLPPSPGAIGGIELQDDGCTQAERGKATDVEDGADVYTVGDKPTAEEAPVSPEEKIGSRQLDQMKKELSGSLFKRTRALTFSRQAEQVGISSSA